MKPTRILSFAAVLTAFLTTGFTAFAADINQVVSNTSGQSWATAATWDNTAAASAGNHYFTNGYTLRTPDAPAGSTTFPGASLTVDGGTGSARGSLSLKAGTTNIANLLIGVGSVSSSVNNGSTNLPATLSVTNLTILASATTENRARLLGSSTNQNIYLNVGTLSGSGYVEFGSARANTLSLTDGSAFTGTLGVLAGSLTLNSNVGIANATFSIASSGATLVLNNDLTVSSFSFGATQLGQGLYTSSQLNTQLSTSAFSGTGLVQVGAIPEPSTYAAILGGLALSTVVLVRRRSR